MSEPYKTSFTSLRTNATSLLGQCMALDSVSRWRGELVLRCHDLLKAIAWVEEDEKKVLADEKLKAEEKQS